MEFIEIGQEDAKRRQFHLWIEVVIECLDEYARAPPTGKRPDKHRCLCIEGDPQDSGIGGSGLVPSLEFVEDGIGFRDLFF